MRATPAAKNTMNSEPKAESSFTRVSRLSNALPSAVSRPAIKAPRNSAVVLGPNSGWTEDRVKRLIGGKNQTIPLPRQIDIHIEYFTAFVDEDGKLRTREDVYGYSRKVRAALGLTG